MEDWNEEDLANRGGAYIEDLFWDIKVQNVETFFIDRYFKERENSIINVNTKYFDLIIFLQ